MKIKHKDEWPQLIKIARYYNLDNEQTIILLALREFKDGEEGFEFKEITGRNRTLDEQAGITAKYIKTLEYSYQSYLKRMDEEIEYVKDLLEYITTIDAYPVSRYVNLIIKEFENASNATTSTVG